MVPLHVGNERILFHYNINYIINLKNPNTENSCIKFIIITLFSIKRKEG